MKYNRFGTEDISFLGLGTMRLPERDGQVDEEKAIEMIRYAIDHGVNYIDTAFPYHGGKSEKVLGKALQDGYRERVIIADKCPVWLVKSKEDFLSYFNKQCQRLGVDCIDNYLIHGINASRWETFRHLGLYDLMLQLRAEGKIRYISFSFHDTNRLFREIIDTYSWDMCQIQLNYMDQEMQAGVDGLRYAAEKGVAVAIMEPLKGGRLAAGFHDAVQRVWAEAPVSKTPAHWAFDWIASQKGVTVVLSGMSSMEQLQENLNLFERQDLGSMREEEMAVIEKVRQTYGTLIKYPCTYCKYCMPCQQAIEIPRVLAFYNEWFLSEERKLVKNEYRSWLLKHGSDCIGCKACEEQCPQGFPISRIMAEAADIFGI